MAVVLIARKSDLRVLPRSGFRLVPFILDSGMRYRELENRYLRDRASGRWTRSGRHSGYDYRRELAEGTNEAYAKDLCNFVGFQEATRTSCADDPVEVQTAYRSAMSSGRWSAANALSASSIRRRLGVAADYVRWLADQGELQPRAATGTAPTPGRKPSYRMLAHGAGR